MNVRFLLSTAIISSFAGAAAAEDTRLPSQSVGPLDIRGEGSKGNGSEFCVRVPNSALCRKLRDRASETINILDQGADPSGVADNSGPFSAAAAVALANKRAIDVPPGAYRLDAPFAPPINVPLSARGAVFTTGQFANIGDLTKYPSFIYFKSSDTPDTDNAVSIGFETRSSPAASNYQKSGLFVRATTYDSGSCTGSPLTGCKDIVAITATGNVAPGTQQGRAYGMNITAALGLKATGSAVAVEFDVYNHTGIDHTAGFYAGAGGTGKSTIYATNAVCGGNAPCDAAFYVSSLNPAQAKFAAGLRMLRGAVRDYVLEVNDDTVGSLSTRPVWIKPNGDAQFNALTATDSAVFTKGFFSTGATIVGGNTLTLNSGTGSGAARIIASSGPVEIAGPSGMGALTGLFFKAGDPTVDDVPTGRCADYFNTSTATFKHWCNYGNTLRSVTLN